MTEHVFCNDFVVFCKLDIEFRSRMQDDGEILVDGGTLFTREKSASSGYAARIEVRLQPPADASSSAFLFGNHRLTGREKTDHSSNSHVNLLSRLFPAHDALNPGPLSRVGLNAQLYPYLSRFLLNLLLSTSPPPVSRISTINGTKEVLYYTLILYSLVCRFYRTSSRLILLNLFPLLVDGMGALTARRGGSRRIHSANANLGIGGQCQDGSVPQQMVAAETATPIPRAEMRITLAYSNRITKLTRRGAPNLSTSVTACLRNLFRRSVRRGAADWSRSVGATSIASKLLWSDTPTGLTRIRARGWNTLLSLSGGTIAQSRRRVCCVRGKSVKRSSRTVNQGIIPSL